VVDEKKVEFWNARASLNANPGTDDYNLKNLEEKEIFKHIPNNANILDIGCGNGSTLIRLVLEKNCTGVGIDFSEKMIASARQASEQMNLNTRVSFFQDSIPDLKKNYGIFDCIISERCIINLESHTLQHQAFDELMTFLKPGGIFLMIESFSEGLEKVNALRSSFGLEPISAPWHNLFLTDTVVREWQGDQYKIDQVIHFSSAYYYLSRVIYAKIAQNHGEPVRYDSEINKIACQVPPFGEFGPTRLYLWKKNVL
jgi:cyclopropane fatty-acyl-phospholipid synthase-like methyltransferase